MKNGEEIERERKGKLNEVKGIIARLKIELLVRKKNKRSKGEGNSLKERGGRARDCDWI